MDEIERLRKKLESFPSPSSYSRLAELLRLGGNAGEAADLCRRCIQEFPRHGQAYVILAGLQLSRGQRGEARSTLEQGVGQDRRCYTGLRMLSDLSAEDGDLVRAVSCLEEILSFKPTDEAVERRRSDLAQHLPAGGNAPRKLTVGGGNQTDTVDLTEIARARTSTLVKPVTPRPGSGVRPTSSSGLRPASTGLSTPLAPLCAEQGVRGAVVVDVNGRVVMSQGLASSREDLLAALACEITASASEALGTMSSIPLVAWCFQGTGGQVLCFRRQEGLSLVVEAESSTKQALIELRARQALISMGGAA